MQHDFKVMYVLKNYDRPSLLLKQLKGPLIRIELEGVKNQAQMRLLSGRLVDTFQVGDHERFHSVRAHARRLLKASKLYTSPCGLAEFTALSWPLRGNFLSRKVWKWVKKTRSNR